MITIDLSKIDKSRIENYEYTNSAGEVVKQKNYKMEVVELTSTKTLKEGDTWTLKKTHAVVEGQSKEERASQAETKFIGDGLQFANKQEQPQQAPAPVDNDDINPEDIPF